MSTYTGGLLAPKVEMAFGADPDGDPVAWTWTDVSDRVLHNPGVTITKGRGDEAGQASPTRINLTLKNADGRFTPGLAGPYYPNVRRNVPLRVSLPYGSSPTTERATGFVDSYSPRWDLSLRQAVVGITASGRLRRLNQSGELRSALYRTLVGASSSTIAPVAYWPAEDGSGAKAAASGVVAALPMATSGVTFAADSSLSGSDDLPTLESGATMVGTVPAYTVTGQWCALCVVNIPDAVAADTLLFEVNTNGSARHWRCYITPAAPDTLRLNAYDSSVTQVLSTSVNLTEAEVYGQWVLVSLGVKQDGADVDYEAWMRNPVSGNAWGVSGTLAGRTHGNATSIAITASDDLASAAMGHFAIYTNPTFNNLTTPASLSEAMTGHDGETPVARFERLCSERGVPQVVSSVTDTEIKMGPQRVANLVALLRECEEVDAGLIHDGAPGGKLAFVTRAWRYNRPVAMTVSMLLGQLAADFEVEYDDQRIVNDATVSRSGGSSARVVDQDSIDDEGLYEKGVTLNVHDDTQVYELAGWRIALGRSGLRYPTLSLNLRASPELAQQWLDCGIGSRVQVTQLMSQHPAGAVDVFIEGYREVLSIDTWKVGLNCSAAAPYVVGVLNDATLGVLDSMTLAL